ncbi:O-methyltransferase [Oceanobacillus sp. FSL K6-2867]|uniref:O-methyltransferase n=1 Tax=Oceanobacillus sp. FSL K6-2867 TaxID=2954748 RepID=UPI0030DC5170
MNEEINNYLTGILPEQEDWITRLETEAKADHVPIMDRAGMNFVVQLVRLTRPENILEIGTAIGYSALRMQDASSDSFIVTIEKDEQRYMQAIKNIEALGKQQQINVIQGDALDKLVELADQGKRFDLIFIDAAKGQYERFFELASPMLNPNSVIISDNVLFRGYVANPVDVPKRYQKMVEKIRNYNKMLMNHPDFKTSILPIGDGVAVSYKMKEEEVLLREG